MKKFITINIIFAILITSCGMPIAHAVDAILLLENPHELQNNQAPAAPAPQPPAPIQQPFVPMQQLQNNINQPLMHHVTQHPPQVSPAIECLDKCCQGSEVSPALECCDKCCQGSELCCAIACLGCIATPLALTYHIGECVTSCICCLWASERQQPQPCYVQEAIEGAMSQGQQLRTLICGQMQ